MGACHSECGPDKADIDAADDQAQFVGDEACRPADKPEDEQEETRPPESVAIEDTDPEHEQDGDAMDHVMSEDVLQIGLPRLLSPASDDEMGQKVAFAPGFFTGLDTRMSNAKKVLEQYGIADLEDDSTLAEHLLGLKKRVISSPPFQGKLVVGVMMDSSLMTAKLAGGTTIPKYLWRSKNIVPFLSLPLTLQAEKNGVQMVDTDGLDRHLSGASATKMYGVKARSMIRAPHKKGIQQAVDQQFDIIAKVMEYNLVPVAHLEVDIEAQDKTACELLLLKILMDKLDSMDGETQILLCLTLPNKPNTYQQLCYHPRVMRLLALSGGYSRDDSCTMLSQNVCMTACFSRALLEGLKKDMETDDFSAHLKLSCERICECCMPAPEREQQLAKISTQDGILGVLDDRSLVSGDLLERYGHRKPKDGWTEARISAKAGQATWRIVTDRAFSGSQIIGAVIHESVMNVKVEDRSLPEFLWGDKKVVPILQLARQENTEGTKLRGDVDTLLAQAKEQGFFAVRLTSTQIKKPEKAKIRAMVEEQLTLAQKIWAVGLVPSLMIEVSPTSAKRADCEYTLMTELVRALANLQTGQQVLLDLTVPSEPNLYLPLTQNSSVIRVAARCQGSDLAHATASLSKMFGVISGFARAFTDGLKLDQDAEDFTRTLDNTVAQLFRASTLIPLREVQAAKVTNTEGFIIALDHTKATTASVLKGYGIEEAQMESKDDVQAKMRELRERILSSSALAGSTALAVSLSSDMLSVQINNRPVAKFIWEIKNIVPFVSIDRGLQAEKKGVQMFADVPDLEKVLTKALKAGALGVKIRSVIKAPDKEGIAEAVKQQLKLARKVLDKSMMPVLQVEIDGKAKDKQVCEQQLMLQLMTCLKVLKPSERVLLWLSLPEGPNVYMPLLAHPNVCRIAVHSGGCDHAQACKRLSQNIGLVAGFGKSIMEGLAASQSDEDFTNALAKTCSDMFQYSRHASTKQMQLARISFQDGFIAALDSGGTNLTAIMQEYGLQKSDLSNEGFLKTEAQKMRTRILTNPAFNGSRVIGCVLPEDMMAISVGGVLPAKYLWEVKRIVPFLRIDNGPAQEAKGVRMIGDLDSVQSAINKAVAFGCLGTKARSVIKAANADGIKELVEQQFQVAGWVLAKGLIPILQLEVDKDAQDKPMCEQILRQAVTAGLKRLEGSDKIILQVTLPTKANIYYSLVSSPKMLRCIALSGGYSTVDACKKLQNSHGFIGAFGRALTQDLKVSQTEGEFSKMLDSVLDSIFLSSLKDIRADGGNGEEEREGSKENPRKDSRKKTETPDAPVDEVVAGA